MSECNCCSCAYHSPPWWVTMGYGGNAWPGPTQPQQSPGVQPTSGGVVVPPPPPARAQTAPATATPALANPVGHKPTATQVVSDLASGNVVSVLTDFVELF